MMPTLQKPIKGRLAPRPKLAATIILVREHKGDVQILMGKRSSRHDFMPSIYVFPGGRVDPSDTYAPSHDHINSRTREILEHAMPPARARACVMAAVRETFEETSLVLGEKFEAPPKAVNDASWQAFHARGYLPELADIDVLGRAITPPHRNKRFDTWFFISRLDGENAQRPISTSAELVDLNWFTFSQIAELDMHPITKSLLRQAQQFLNMEHPPNDVFFSRAVYGKFDLTRFPQ